MPVERLFFADDRETLGASAGGRKGIILAFLYISVLVFPQVGKAEGRVRVEWIGLYTDYAAYKLGLSPKPAQWMRGDCAFLELARSGVTSAKSFEQGLGCLGFAALCTTGVQQCATNRALCVYRQCCGQFSVFWQGVLLRG